MKIQEEWSPEFALRVAIEEQVRKEDLVGWAESPVEPHHVVAPLPSTKWRPAPKYVFGNGIIRFAHKLLP